MADLANSTIMTAMLTAAIASVRCALQQTRAVLRDARGFDINTPSPRAGAIDTLDLFAGKVHASVNFDTGNSGIEPTCTGIGTTDLFAGSGENSTVLHSEAPLLSMRMALSRRRDILGPHVVESDNG